MKPLVMPAIRLPITTTRGPLRRGADPLLLTRTGVPHSRNAFAWTLERALLRS